MFTIFLTEHRIFKAYIKKLHEKYNAKCTIYSNNIDIKYFIDIFFK